MTVEDGLTDATNHFIYKDSKGFVWISSINGLNRYDGREVKTYQSIPGDSTSLLGQNVQSSFFEDEASNLWFCTFDGINCYNRKQENFQHFPLEIKPGVYGKEGYHIFHKDKKNNLWLLVSGLEVYLFNTVDHTFKKIHDYERIVHRLFPVLDQQGEVLETWAIFYQHPAIYKTVFDQSLNARQTKLYLTDGHKDTLQTKQLLWEAPNLVWVAAREGFFSYNPLDGSVQQYRSEGNQGVIDCNSIANFWQHELLIATAGDGVLRFDKTTRRFVGSIRNVPNNPHSLSSNNVNKIIADQNGGYWLSIDDRGVDFFYPSKQKFQKLTLTDDPSSPNKRLNVTAILEDEAGNVWCGTARDGIYVFDSQKQVIRRLMSPQSSNAPPLLRILHLFTDKQHRVWICTWSGLWVYDTKSNRLQQVTQPDQVMLHGRQLADGRIIVAGFLGGLFEMARKGDNFMPQPIPAVSSDKSYPAFAEDQNGRLFACESVTSVAVFDVKNDFKRLKELPISGNTMPFAYDHLRNCYWIGSNNGLVKVNSDLSVKHTFTSEDGLTGQTIQAIGIEKDHLWLSTNRGISRLDTKEGTFTNYTLSDGLPALEFSPLSFLHKNNGEMWFGSTNGVAIFHPSEVTSVNTAANPVITSIRINDQPDSSLVCLLTGATNASEIRQIELAYNHNTISFVFAALEYSDPSKTKFKYMLQNFDNQWVDAGVSNLSRYANLPPGDYVFMLKAANSDGVWSEKTHLLEIRVKRPYWKTWWFYTACVLGATGLIGYIVYSIIERRRRRKKAEEDKKTALELERQRIARDVHDDLGSGLSALNILTEFARYKDSPEELRGEIEKINFSARELSSKIREVIWTVSSKNDQLDNLLSYLHHYANDLFENTAIDCQIELPEDIPNLTISGEHRRTVFLAYKEALNNIVKHAGASHVVISFESAGKKLEITIADNGRGFDPELLLHSTGNGLLNMKNRMKEIGGDCEISTGGAGTRLVFALNLVR